MRVITKRYTTRYLKINVGRRLRVDKYINLRLITNRTSSITIKRNLLNGNDLNRGALLLTRDNDTIRVNINDFRTLNMINGRYNRGVQIFLNVLLTRRNRTNSRLNVHSLIPFLNRIRNRARNIILRTNYDRVKLKRGYGNVLNVNRLDHSLNNLTMMFGNRILIQISTINIRGVTRRMLQHNTLTNKRSNATYGIYRKLSHVTTFFRCVRRTRHISNRDLGTTLHLLVRNNNRVYQSNDRIRLTLRRRQRSLVNDTMGLRIMVRKDNTVLFRTRRISGTRDNKTFRTNGTRDVNNKRFLYFLAKDNFKSNFTKNDTKDDKTKYYTTTNNGTRHGNRDRRRKYRFFRTKFPLSSRSHTVLYLGVLREAVNQSFRVFCGTGLRGRLLYKSGFAVVRSGVPLHIRQGYEETIKDQVFPARL